MNLTQLLHRNVQQRPQREAVIYEGQSWTYLELQSRVARVAGVLRSLALGEGDRVGLMSMNSNPNSILITTRMTGTC